MNGHRTSRWPPRLLAMRCHTIAARRFLLEYDASEGLGGTRFVKPSKRATDEFDNERIIAMLFGHQAEARQRSVADRLTSYRTKDPAHSVAPVNSAI